MKTKDKESICARKKEKKRQERMRKVVCKYCGKNIPVMNRISATDWACSSHYNVKGSYYESESSEDSEEAITQEETCADVLSGEC